MSLVNTRLLAARAAYPTLLDRDQLRKDQFGLIDVAVRSNSNPNSYHFGTGSPNVKGELEVCKYANSCNEPRYLHGNRWPFL